MSAENARFAAELFPQHTKHSGAAAVLAAADTVAETAEWRRKVAAALDIPADTPVDAAATIAADTLRRARA